MSALDVIPAGFEAGAARPPRREHGATSLRVLHVAETLIGGPASYINGVVPDHIRHFGRDGVRIIGPADQLTHLAEPGVCIPFERSGRNLASVRRLQRRVEETIAWFQPDIVHLHSFFAGIAVRAFMDRAALADAAVIYCPHGWAFRRRTSVMSRCATWAIEWALQGRADQIHCVSQYEFLAGARAGLESRKLFCLPNRIPDVAAKPTENAPGLFSGRARLRAAFIGRLDRQKGFDVLSRAARLCGPEIEIAAAGAVAVDSGVVVDPPANVRMLGWLSREAADALIREADVVVMPSRWEGLPLVGLEAMRAGKALVASRVDGVPELVDHGVTGLLVPSGDAQALAEALRTLTPERARAMGAAARRKYDLFFSFVDYAEALRWRYAALVGARRSFADVTQARV